MVYVPVAPAYYNHDGTPTYVIEGKGEFVSKGISGIVERTAPGVVMKSPMPGITAFDGRDDLTIEAQIYRTLDYHPRLVKVIDWDAESCVLSLEFIENGTLEDYLTSHPDTLLMTRLKWALQACESLHVLHSAGVTHCDLNCQNLLIDGDLNLRVIDFAGSSLDNSEPTGAAASAFRALDALDLWNAKTDLFALGSVLYHIITGRTPYHDKSDEEIDELCAEGKFADTHNLLLSETISGCWHGRFQSASEVLASIFTICLS